MFQPFVGRLIIVLGFATLLGLMLAGMIFTREMP